METVLFEFLGALSIGIIIGLILSLIHYMAQKDCAKSISFYENKLAKLIIERTESEPYILINQITKDELEQKNKDIERLNEIIELQKQSIISYQEEFTLQKEEIERLKNLTIEDLNNILRQKI